MAPCARCGSQQHAVAACPYPFHKTFCSVCGKSHPHRRVCPMVSGALPKKDDKEQRASLKDTQQQNNRDVQKLLAQEHTVRLSISASLSGDTKTDSAGVEWRMDRKTGWWWWRNQNGEWQSQNKGFGHRAPQKKIAASSTRRPSDGSVAASDKSQCLSVSTAATSTLSPEEEKEVERMETKLRQIVRLQDRKAQGQTLNRFEESAIRCKAEIDYAPLMLKVRAERSARILFLDEMADEMLEVLRDRSDAASEVSQTLSLDEMADEMRLRLDGQEKERKEKKESEIAFLQ